MFWTFLHFNWDLLTSTSHNYWSILKMKTLFFLLVKSGRRLIGYSIIHLIKADNLRKFLLKDAEMISGFFENDHLVQLRKTTALHHDFTGKGIGSEFIRHTMKMLCNKCDFVVSVNWKKDNEIPMEKISRELGMTELVEIKDYWKEDSMKSGFHCPECGNPPCNCSAVFFVRKAIN